MAHHVFREAGGRGGGPHLGRAYKAPFPVFYCQLKIAVAQIRYYPPVGYEGVKEVPRSLRHL